MKTAVTTEIEFICPFCNRYAAVVRPAGVVHSLPMCREFDVMEVNEYLHAVNRALRGHDDN
jgi:hypothetical protein